MGETNSQCAVASHGKSADSSRLSPCADTISAFNERHELAEKEIAVEGLAVAGIDVERIPSVRRDEQKIPDLVVPAQILQFRPLAGHSRRLFVSSQTVQKVQNRITLCLRSRSGIIRRQENTVAHRG